MGRKDFSELKKTPAFRKWRKLQRERQQDRCFYEPLKNEIKWASACKGSLIGQGAYHIDHILPIAGGGQNWLSNLVLSCSRCNQNKTNRFVDPQLILKCLGFLINPSPAIASWKKKDKKVFRENKGGVNWKLVFKD